MKTDYLGRPDYTEKWDFNVPEIPTFPETDSGRRRKGELECLVDYVIKEWLCACDNDEDMETCTAEYIAQRCEELDGRSTSSGSVWKILEYFSGLEYAIIREKPNRFICLTSKGMEVGLRQLKELDNRAKKRAKRNADIEQFNKAQIVSKIRKGR